MLLNNLPIEKAHDKIITAIRAFFKKACADKAVLGLSGGIDSAVVMALAVEALGNKNVHGILMPSPFSTMHSINDAVTLAENLDSPYTVIPIGSIYHRFLKELDPLFKNTDFDTTEENLQARIRGTILMAYSNKFKALLLNTSNKSELSVGYGTLYGDLCGALMVIADLYKIEVYELASYINREKTIIPESTMTKAPSAELRDNQKDTDSLPEYSKLDPLLYALHEEGRNPDELEKEYGKEFIDRVLKLKSSASFKAMQFAPIVKVGTKPLSFREKWFEV